MKQIHKVALALFLGFASLPVAGAVTHGQEPGVTIDEHPWARFGLGSWKQVRVFNETLNAAGQVESTSVTDTKTSLTEVGKDTYTLKTEFTVEVAGKRFTAEPRLVRQGFNGETLGQTVEVKRMGPGETSIDGQKYPVEVRKVVINGDEFKRVSTLHYSPLIAPHVLWRETKAISADSVKPSFESWVSVIAVDMPYRVLSETKLVSLVKTTQTQANGTQSIVLEVHCNDVPGGVVAHSAKELNETGQVVSRSTLELIEYEVVPAGSSGDVQGAGRRRVFHRSRGRSPGE